MMVLLRVEARARDAAPVLAAAAAAQGMVG